MKVLDPVLLKETRGEIVNLLKTRQGLSASELAEELELHSMTIRQHLAILESNDYIMRTKEKSNRGRPKFFYHLTQKAKEKISPRSYPQFAVGLLDTLASTDGSEKVNHLLRTHIENKVQAEIENSTKDDKAELIDPETDASRVKKTKWLVMIGVCTHLGCVPLGDRGEYKGWFCPCHGSHYDTSGRVRKGPAPDNLPVPPYKFISDTKIIIG